MKDNQENRKVMGVVLAGGLSSRMGKDKALLKIASSTMIKRTERLLRNTSVDKVVISRNDGNPSHFSDIISGAGPLSGIHSIATRFPHYNLLIQPVDLPLMDTKNLESLIACGREQSKNVRFNGSNLPLFVQNTPQFRQILDYTLKYTQSYSVARLCSHFLMLELRSSAGSKIFNTNTPEQWRFAMQHFETNHQPNTQEARYESF